MFSNLFGNLFKKKKNTIVLTPKFKVGEQCIWKYKDITYNYVINKLVIINNVFIDGDSVKYIVIDKVTNMIYEWVNENELESINVLKKQN